MKKIIEISLSENEIKRAIFDYCVKNNQIEKYLNTNYKIHFSMLDGINGKEIKGALKSSVNTDDKKYV